MTNAERILVLKKALEMTAKVIRDNPPEMDWHLADSQRMKILAGGANRDPEGAEYVNYFIAQAYQDLKEKGLVE